MILSKDYRTVKIGSQYFYHDVGALPRFVFDPDAIVGMDDTPEIRRDTVDRPWSHGTFFDRGFYASRLVTMSGHALAKTPQELYKMRDTLVHLFRTGETQWVSFYSENGTGVRHIRAALGGRITWTQMTDTYAQWRFDLYAADPRAYSNMRYSTIYPVEATGAGIHYPLLNSTDTSVYIVDYNLDHRSIPTNAVLNNEGNEEAWPVFKVYGSFATGFSIRSSGKIITYTGGTSRNTPVVIDTFAGTATYGTGDRSYNLTRRDWMSIPAYGSTSLSYHPNLVNDESTWVDVEWRSTWI